MVLCHCMNAVSVVGHSNPTSCKRICLTFLQSQVAGPQGLLAQALAPSIMPSHLVKLSLFFIWLVLQSRKRREPLVTSEILSIHLSV